MPISIQLDPDLVNAVDLQAVAPRTTWHANAKYFQAAAGVEAYRLLAYLASKMPDGARVADVGTYLGYSALALSTAPHVHVESYDVADFVDGSAPSAKGVPNITLHIRDCFDDMATIQRCPLISLDFDTETDTKLYARFVEHLAAAGYQGIVVCDDVCLNDAMRSFWKRVAQPKIDATLVGHWSGSGIIVFGDQFDIHGVGAMLVT